MLVVFAIWFVVTLLLFLLSPKRIHCKLLGHMWVETGMKAGWTFDHSEAMSDLQSCSHCGALRSHNPFTQAWEEVDAKK